MTLKKILLWVQWPLIGILGALIVLLFVKPTTVSGPSMDPNLSNGEHVWVFKRMPIHRGSVIVFNSDGVDPTTDGNKLYVKRVIGLPGDKVVSDQGVIYVNGRPISQKYISAKERKATGNWTFKSLAKKHNWATNQNAVVVSDNTYFVLGDHRSVSNDSRYFGFVPKNKILGIVKVFWWTSDSDTHRNNINKEWKNYFQTASVDDN